MKKNSNQKVAIIVAFKDFKDEEYFKTKEAIEKNGLKVITVSNKEGTACGESGGEAEVDLVLTDLRAGNYSGIVFIGGPGCLDNLDNDNSYRITTETVGKNKILGAICISPVILAKAGVLEDKKATVWSDKFYKESIEILERHEALYQDTDVVIDDNIITANGPDAAEKFGEAVALRIKE